MRELLPRSSALSGLIVGLEGLAFWILTIFLASFIATGSITRPGADMYTTTVVTMQNWFASPAIGGVEALGYLGLVLAIGGPTWFWVARPGYERVSDRFATRGTPEGTTASGSDPASSGAIREANPDPGNSAADSLAAEAAEGVSAVIPGDDSSGPDPIEQALAEGDFRRGGGDADQSTDEASDDDADWRFGEDRDAPALPDPAEQHYGPAGGTPARVSRGQPGGTVRDDE